MKMETQNFNTNIVSTNDEVIRAQLKNDLEQRHYGSDHKVRIIEELGVRHGVARIDIAVVNGILHGYEIKSDKDTLKRLPEQMRMYDSVFDRVTLVVGRAHLFEAINLVPDWWGIMSARVDENGHVSFNNIREAADNHAVDPYSVVRLLWRNEALKILEEEGQARGLRSKPRSFIYARLTNIFDQATLGKKVRDTIFFRSEWRPDAPLVQNGG